MFTLDSQGKVLELQQKLLNEGSKSPRSLKQMAVTINDCEEKINRARRDMVTQINKAKNRKYSFVAAPVNDSISSSDG